MKKIFIVLYLVVNLYSNSFSNLLSEINEEKYVSALNIINKGNILKYKNKLESLSFEKKTIQVKYTLFLIYFELKENKKALEILKELVDKKYSEAQNTLGNFYETGRLVKKNKEKGFQLYLLSANNNSMEGQYNLGRSYVNGIGTLQNYKNAFKWFEKSANAGYAEAYSELGVFYIKGNYVKNDDLKAVELFKKSINLGNNEAKCRIAVPLVLLKRFKEAKRYTLEGYNEGYRVFCKNIWQKLDLKNK